MNQYIAARNAYIRACKEAGFTSDEHFMSAWRSDPERWRSLFSLRMSALNLLPSIC